MTKDVLDCVQAVVGKKKFLVQFIDSQEIYKSDSLMLYVWLQEEFDQ